MANNVFSAVITNTVANLDAVEFSFSARCEFLFGHFDICETALRMFFGADFRPEEPGDIEAAWPLGMCDMDGKPVIVRRKTLVKAQKERKLYDEHDVYVMTQPKKEAVYSYSRKADIKWTNKAFFEALFQYKFCGGQFTTIRAFEAAQKAADKILKELGLED